MMTVSLDKIIAFGLLLTVVFTALAHGAVEAWSAAVFELLVLLLAVLWTIKWALEREIEIRLPSTAYPIAAFLVYALVQSVVITDANGQGKSLSADPEATRSAATILFFLLVAHVIAANFFAARERLKTLTVFLSAYGLLLAAFALIQHFTWNEHIFWIRPTKTGGGTFVTGSFVNHNHFASYMELLIPIPAAIIFANALKYARALLAFAAVLMAIAAVAALSRGGMISLTGGGLFVLTAGFYQASRKKLWGDSLIFTARAADGFGLQNRLPWIFNLAGSVMIAGAIALGTILIGSEPVFNRITNNSVLAADGQAQNFENARGWMWRNSWTMFRENPVFGVGFGAYETAFPKTSESDGIIQYGAPFIFDRAHNDYLQILTDTGIIGGLIAVWFISLVFLNISRALRLRDTLNQGLAVGSGAAIITLIIHSFFDFSLQLPGIALLFLVVTAISSNLAMIETGSRKALRNPSREVRLLPAARI